ncbi:MAG TPA: ABC transporter substrate-binding protein [Candidatus Pacearchaeota archaeon]|nr:peptidoglycan-binding protein [Candidatus Parcubacteria bacterium]HNZ83902.1 ABC transporter substrate-binding protein [Candidatus Pacearchaeota archaeon]HOU45767.1 ABC transporter substrate-binding protein [Candidatus Pacearchaeota archaeon]HPM08397.1 ABC transporter substrate-binding protein [Candidatus Pacearchaeota archaeon]
MHNWPNFKQWMKLPSFLNKKEKVTLYSSVAVFVLSFLFLVVSFYYSNTKQAPAFGGKYTEGIVGKTGYINPVLASRDIERDLNELVFSGLMRYDSQGNLVNDLLVTDPEIKDNGRTYEVYLRSDIYFHDGHKVDADDVIFTIKTIQDPEYKSPLRPNWLGVTVEKISDVGIRFRLKNPYPDFKERLTVKIIPQHIWNNITASEFFTSPYNNKQAIGSGPYKIKKSGFKKDFSKVIELEAYDKYHLQKPYIKELTILVFSDEKELIKSAKAGKIDGFMTRPSPELKIHGFNDYQFLIPRYFALFFNLKDSAFQNKEFRQALNYATDKDEIIKKVFGGKAQKVDSPVLPDFYGFPAPTSTYQYDINKAKEILLGLKYEYNQDGKLLKPESQNFKFKTNLAQGSIGEEVKMLQKCLAQFPEIYPEGKITGIFGKGTADAVSKFQEKYAQEILIPNNLEKGNGKVKGSTQEKLNQICFGDPNQSREVKLTVYTTKTSNYQNDYLSETAQIIKEQWAKIGIDLEVKAVATSPTEKSLEIDIIRPRAYQTLIFGYALKMMPDPFPFWHSSQSQDPGFNLSLYDNKAVDKILEQLREEENDFSKTEKYEKLQELISQDAPCVFLYNPQNSYIVDQKIKGIENGKGADLSKRFSNASSWYIKTKRIWK